MRYVKALVLILIVSFFTVSCFEDNDDNLISASQINDFVWKGMNSWYFWQQEVPNLSDEKDDNNAAYTSFLNSVNPPKDFFNSLRYQIGLTDRFSWFVEDYIVLQQQFQGISKSFGIDFEPVQINNNGDVIIYISYVADNSPAKTANIKRGDIVNAINGTTINTSNFSELQRQLFGDNVTLSFVSENNGSLEFIEDKTISSEVIFKNPVYLKKIFNDINGKKVGYLVYNGFRSSYNDELNAAFQDFKSEGITELILDLRLNGGGSVSTSSYLASMIYANAGEDKFADLKFNSKHENENGFYNFSNRLNVFNSDNEKTGEETINRLNTISRLYVLTSKNTASASEMVINGLKPFITVKTVGTTTFGKNVGSITLYDSPLSDYQNKASANPSHLNAMQPIVFKIFNKNGESDYTQGFAPEIEVKEYQFWNNILPFGDENEIVLKAALDDIKGLTSKSSIKKKASFSKKIDAKVLSKTFENDMYIENDFFNN